ncbi:MAG TPA: DUF177 domain-containing protein [Gemmatimonadaceae bacterium]|nr:DUF177 domain-containing protein [Gemmatimonadaceae bacterium]
MLSFEIRELARRAVDVDGLLESDDPVWQAGDEKPSEPLHATGRLSVAGASRYYWSGHIDGLAHTPCRRCLADSTVRVREEVHVFFVEAGDEIGDDPDTYRLPPRAQEVDLRPAIREQWLLAAPAFVLCREDCKGLCPRCGADLNAGPCTCASEVDPRWAVLREPRGGSVER